MFVQWNEKKLMVSFEENTGFIKNKEYGAISLENIHRRPLYTYTMHLAKSYMHSFVLK
jgi:hypothetical protein